MALREVNHGSGTAGGGRTSCHGARGRLRCILAQHRAQAVGLVCVDRECLRQQLRVEFFGLHEMHHENRIAAGWVERVDAVGLGARQQIHGQ